MSLLTYQDLQTDLNIDLTDPNGQELVTELITSAVAIVEGAIGYPLEAAEQTAYFEDGAASMFLPTRAPVSAVSLSTYNPSTGAYDAVESQYVRYSVSGEVRASIGLPSGFMAVKATYTAGWSAETLPADLRGALVELCGLKLQERGNYSTDPASQSSDTDSDSDTATNLKRVEAGSVTVEYASGESEARWKAKLAQLSRGLGDDIPANITQIFDAYRKPVIR